MPTSTLRFAGLRQYGLQSLVQPASYRPNDVMIGTWSWCAAGPDIVSQAVVIASQTYPGTNRAIGYMFCIADHFLVQKVWWVNGTTATTDAADVGVYNEAGTVLIVSGGSTNIATANVVQEKDCTDTLLQPGRYWCVYNQNGVTATPMCAPIAVVNSRPMGFAQFAGAVPLGASFTPAAIAGTTFPLFGIARRTQVA